MDGRERGVKPGGGGERKYQRRHGGTVKKTKVTLGGVSIRRIEKLECRVAGRRTVAARLVRTRRVWESTVKVASPWRGVRNLDDGSKVYLCSRFINAFNVIGRDPALCLKATS